MNISFIFSVFILLIIKNLKSEGVDDIIDAEEYYEDNFDFNTESENSDGKNSF